MVSGPKTPSLARKSIRFNVAFTRSLGEGELNQQKNRAYQAWHELRRSAVGICARFLWSIQTMNSCSAPSSQCLQSSRAISLPTTHGSLYPHFFQQVTTDEGKKHRGETSDILGTQNAKGVC